MTITITLYDGITIKGIAKAYPLISNDTSLMAMYDPAGRKIIPFPPLVDVVNIEGDTP